MNKCHDCGWWSISEPHNCSNRDPLGYNGTPLRNAVLEALAVAGLPGDTIIGVLEGAGFQVMQS
jgi:hypothetical protein